jgi:hypothetical protein
VRTIVTWLVLAIGCGSPTTTRTVDYSPPTDSGARLEMSEIRALLDRYSSTGSWIVRSDETLPNEFTVAGRKVTLSSTATFAKYFDTRSRDRVVDEMTTAVHEVYHAITTRLGYQLLVATNPHDLVDVQGLYTDGAPLLVHHNVTYPAREMNATYPADAKTFRYPTYVSPSGETNSTQTDGVFGLLDEWAAYYHGAHIVMDFWPWVRDVAPRTQDLYWIYRVRFHNMWVAYAEFKLFILHYVLHARTHRPDVHRALLANASFRRAFVETDDAWTELLDSATQLEPAIASIATERGAARMNFGGEAAYPAVQRALASEPYQRVLAELRGR